jgi:hypothetical protein
MRNLLVFYAFMHLFLLLALSSCSHQKATDRILSEIEDLIEYKPDSALILLETLYPYDKMGKLNQAYYNILLTEAKHRNESSLLACDSLITFTIDFLNNKSNKLLLTKALICKAYIKEELRESENAVQLYHDALELLNNDEEYVGITSKIHYNLGNIYYDQNIYNEALKMYMRSYSLDVGLANFRNISLSLKNVGNTYFYLQKPDSAFHYFEQAIFFAKQSNDSVNLLNMIYNDIGIYYMEMGEYENYLHQIRKMSKITDKVYLNKGYAFMFLQQFDSARTYLLLGSESPDIFTKATGYYILNELEKSVENYQGAHFYLNKFLEQRDSIANFTAASEIRTLNHKFNIRIETERVETAYRQKIGVLLFSSLIILLLFLVRYQKKRFQQKETENKLLKKESEFADLQIQIGRTNGELLEFQYKNNSNKELIQQKENELSLLQSQIGNRIFFTTPSYLKIKSLIRLKNANRKNFTEEDRKKLNEDIQISFSELITNLEDDYSSLSDGDILLCCLSKLEIPQAIISILTGSVSTQAVKQQKYRIRKITKLDFDFS